MLANYLKIAFRNLARNPIYSSLNTIGLAVGLACCLLVGFYVRTEVGHDAFHVKGDRIYRIVRGFHVDGTPDAYVPSCGGRVGPEWQAELPDIEHVVRLYFREDGGPWLTAGGRSFKQSFCITDTTILDVFSLPLVAGDPNTCLKEPGGILLTERMAAKFFPDSDPMGQIITSDDRKVKGEYRVTGVLKDLPAKSHLQFDFITATRTTGWGFLNGNYLRNRDGRTSSYVLLREGVDARVLEQKIARVMEKRLPDELRDQATYHLQPIERIYLYSFADYGFNSGGNIVHLMLFVTVALAILILACVNYANLSTARAVKRAREVGLRKVFGAFRIQLLSQFLFESVLVASGAFVLGAALAAFLLPTFSEVVGRSFSFSSFEHLFVVLLVAVLVPIVGLISGSYPAMVLSGFSPGAVLRDFQSFGSGRSLLRKSLVVFQFAVTIALLVITVVVYRQMIFLGEKNLGFDRDQIVAMHLFRQNYDLIPKHEMVKQAFVAVPGVIGATAAQPLMGQYGGSASVTLDKQPSPWAVMTRCSVDKDFLSVMGLELVMGRDLSPTTAVQTGQVVRGPAGQRADAPAEVLLTETAVRRLGLEDPIGQTVVLGFGNFKTTVVGVVKDFHSRALYEEMTPAYLYRWVPSYRWLYLKISSANMSETLAGIEQVWGRLLPGKPFQFVFLDDHLDALYKNEARAQRMFLLFTLIAVAISCSGLWIFATYAAEQRRKEIAIRKVLGATSKEILGKLLNEFGVLVTVAACVALPIGYWVSADWLAYFAFRIDLDLYPFAIAVFLAYFVAFIAVVSETVKAATSNPIPTIQHE